jgi:hypothetical protein
MLARQQGPAASAQGSGDRQQCPDRWGGLGPADAAARGIRLALAGLNPSVLAMVRRQELGRRLGRGGLFFNPELAVEQFGQEHQA